MFDPEEPILIAAVEGGGTSFVVAVAQIEITASNNNNDNVPRILYRKEIDSSHDDPNRTLSECVSFFRKHNNNGNGYRSLGIAMFGPFGVDPNVTNTYGKILPTTPKKSWRDIDVLSPLIDACRGSNPNNNKLLVKIDTDVNAPAVAEYISEKEKEKQQPCNKMKKNISSLAYVTVGTGVGVGLVIHGKPVHGRMHPEAGHVPVQPLDGDNFTGYSWGTNSKSPFKGIHTVESMTSSVALTERIEQITKQTVSLNREWLQDIHDDNPVWDHASNALANLCVTLVLVTSVEKIVLGGGIMKRNGLIEKVRRRTKVLLNGYLGELSDQDVSEWITLSQYGSDVGLMGALVLAQQAITEQQQDGEDDKEREVADQEVIQKRTAYNTGIQHGLLLGLSIAYVGIILYARSGKSSSHRR
jgi:fructokinase